MDDVFIKECVSFDDNTTTTQTLADDWEEEMFRAAKGDVQEDILDSDLESDLEEDEGQTPVMSQLSISHLRQFSVSNGLEKVLEIVSKARDMMDNLVLKLSS